MGAREDQAKADLIARLHALSVKKQTTHDGLFRLYDKDGAGALDRDELRRMLTDADVGNPVTRGTYVRLIFEHVDADRSGGLTLAELDGILARDAVPAPGATLTRAQAAVIARRIAAGEKVDLSQYSQADLSLIEDENLKITTPIPDQQQIPKVPTPKLEPRGSSPPAGGGAVVLALVALLVLARG